MAGRNPALSAQVVAELAQGRRRPQPHERLAGQLCKAYPVAIGQRMVARERYSQRLGGQRLPLDSRIAGPQRPDLEVDLAPVEGRGNQLVAYLLEQEADLRMHRAKAADQIGHEPHSQRWLEGHGDGACLGVDQLGDRGEPVVEFVQHRVDMALEHRARVTHAQRAARATQQRRPDLGLQASEGTRYAGLRDCLEVAHLRHRDAVRDLLEPTQRLDVHSMIVRHGFHVDQSLDA